MKNYQVVRDISRLLVRKLGLLRKNDAVCCGVAVAQCYSLTEIGRREGVTLNELAEVLNLDKSTMSRSVEGLVSRGLVLRQEIADNRRTVNITLTEQGKTACVKIEQVTDEYFKNIMKAIPDEKRSLVVEAMQLLGKAIEKQKLCCSNEKINEVIL
ncbi:MAG: MarR family transcriptional regulator [Negativicutes bacterium]|jgi:DNA-binding MarR family transcriptional regulator